VVENDGYQGGEVDGFCLPYFQTMAAHKIILYRTGEAAHRKTT